MKSDAMTLPNVVISSPPAREVWIEIDVPDCLYSDLQSPPAREVWIEIKLPRAININIAVTSRTGGVD